jgi:hypothetical protein
MLRFLFFGVLLACESAEEFEDEDVIDLRTDYPDPPEGGYQIVTPDFRVEPYEEILDCFFGTWEGPDIGVNQYIPLHPNEFHHHSLVKDASIVIGVEDGDFIPCGADDLDVPPTNAPLFHSIPIAPPEGFGNTLNLPEGAAVKLTEGQRWSADVHFINTTDRPILANVAFNLGLVPEEEVQNWVGSFDHDAGGLFLQPGVETTLSFDCPMQADTYLLSVSAHMHGYGRQYRIELVRADGELIELLNVPDWKEEYRYSSPARGFAPDQYLIEAGDQLRTHCTWFNTTDDVLSFPVEMCTSSGALLGMEEAEFCTGVPIEDLR